MTDFISSIALLERTGLSRATLNNYIKMGMIHPPIVKKPDDPSIKAKRIGYFQDSVIEIIEKIKLYKEKGYPMREIVSLLSNRLSNGHLPEISGSGPARINRRENAGESKESELFFGENSSQVNLSTLVAYLQDSVRICAELPPEEYYGLINQVRSLVGRLLKKYHGMAGQCVFDVMVYYFLKEVDPGYLINSILCASEIRKNMLKLSEQWRENKRWHHDLFINIGISEGNEYCVPDPGMSTMKFEICGDSINCARSLSEMACNGSIWTTKDLMMRLSEKERNRISYGIRQKRQDEATLIEKAYSRVMNLVLQEGQKSKQIMDISSLAVTEILHVHF